MSLRSIRFLVLGLTLAAGAQLAVCGPRISIGDPPNGVPVGSTFGFTSNPSGGGYYYFSNASGFDWTTLDVDVTMPTTANISCAPGVFDTCTVTTLSSAGYNSVFDIGFEGASAAPGVPKGASFTVDLNEFTSNLPNPDPNGQGQWGPGTPFLAIANQADVTTPEPSYAGLLFAMGVLALATGALRKRLAPSVRSNIN